MLEKYHAPKRCKSPSQSNSLPVYIPVKVVKKLSNLYLRAFSTGIDPCPFHQVHARSFSLNLTYSLLQNKLRLNACESKHRPALIS